MTCDTLFFMLSGKFAFNIDVEEENFYSKYYKNKFVKLIIPVIAYMLIKQAHLIVYNFNQELTLYAYCRKFVISLLNGFTYMEYWFLYVLIANMLIAPFIVRMLKNMQKKDFKVFFWLSVIMSCLTTYVQILNIEFGLKYLFVGYTFYFYLGYFVDELFQSKKEKNMIYILGVISLIISFLQIYFNKIYSMTGTAPTFIFITLSVWMFIRDKMYVKNENKYIKNLKLFITKHSLGIYMTHYMFLYLGMDIFYNIIENKILCFLIIVCFDLLLSLIFSFIMDNTIIRFIKYLVNKIFEKIDKIIVKKKNKILNIENKILEEKNKVVEMKN